MCFWQRRCLSRDRKQACRLAVSGGGGITRGCIHAARFTSCRRDQHKQASSAVGGGRSSGIQRAVWPARYGSAGAVGVHGGRLGRVRDHRRQRGGPRPPPQQPPRAPHHGLALPAEGAAAGVRASGAVWGRHRAGDGSAGPERRGGAERRAARGGAQDGARRGTRSREGSRVERRHRRAGPVGPPGQPRRAGPAVPLPAVAQGRRRDAGGPARGLSRRPRRRAAAAGSVQVRAAVPLAGQDG
mmetsp:Transcript_40325/g.84278  ORF Transcript_40325/g.84278 Transcript_40325/m.84278 type:complete len:242 (-) Transcript_40325:397-1122(-)